MWKGTPILEKWIAKYFLNFYENEFFDFVKIRQLLIKFHYDSSSSFIWVQPYLSSTASNHPKQRENTDYLLVLHKNCTVSNKAIKDRNKYYMQ